jgi:WD repeat-containing protein 20
MDEIAVPLRHPSGGSPTFSSGSPSAHWDDITPNGTLLPAPSMRDVPKLSPVVAHRVHIEPLSGLVFTNESVVTICREGHIKIWIRPSHAESHSGQSNSSGEVSIGNATISTERPVISSVKVGASAGLSTNTSSLSFKQQSSVLFS